MESAVATPFQSTRLFRLIRERVIVDALTKPDSLALANALDYSRLKLDFALYSRHQRSTYTVAAIA